MKITEALDEVLIPHELVDAAGVPTVVVRRGGLVFGIEPAPRGKWSLTSYTVVNWTEGVDGGAFVGTVVSEDPWDKPYLTTREVVATLRDVVPADEEIPPALLAAEVQKVIERWLSPSELDVCSTFSDLHDHCDANVAIIEGRELLGLAGVSEEPDFTLDNAASDLVGAWLYERKGA